MKPKHFLQALDDNAIVRAIAEAEMLTSGEIRVFVTEKAVQDVVAEAQKQFLRMGMTNTDQRNGVLIYFAPQSKSFAVMGDEGIHKKGGQSLWDDVVARMTPLLKQNKYTEAVVAGVAQIGEVLHKEFPCETHAKNQLPNTVEHDEPEK
jgi:uncharacterized membrane protein